MKKRIYWVTGKMSYYYVNVETATRNFNMVKDMMPEFPLSLYYLDTVISDEVLEKLLNKSLNHCELPNYQNAVRMEYYHPDF